METHTLSDINSLTKKLSEKLNKAGQEIEELTLQLALGKAEAADKFEEIKKDLRLKVHLWKTAIAAARTTGQKKVSELETRIEELQVQLALGRAEAKDVFEEQKKKILHALSQFEADLKKNPEFNEQYFAIKNEMEKFRLKTEILKLKFELKKFELKDGFKEELSEAKEKISDLFSKVGEKWSKTKSKFTDFNDEIDLAYKHLKKAVKSVTD